MPPPSVILSEFGSDSSLSDSESEVVTLDYTKPKPAPSTGVKFCTRFAQEGSLNSSMITVYVDNIHFRLDSHFLQRESERLRAMISTAEANTIRLHGVSAAEFRALWRFFYEGMYDDYKPSTAEWMDLLSIANTYGLKRVYSHAVAQIEDIDVADDPVQRLVLAKQLNIKKWLAPAYVALCTRTDPIKASEAEKLGIYTFVTLVAARESLYRESFQLTANLKDRSSSVTQNLRCCGNSPSQLHDGANGSKTCPSCLRIVIPGPGIRPAFTNNNRRCCTNQPSQWMAGADGSRTCPSCHGIVLPAVFAANLRCCGHRRFLSAGGTDGAKMICSDCRQIVIPGLDDAGFTNDNRRCCNNPPSLWISQPDGNQVCPSCKGFVSPGVPLSVHDRALAHVRRVFNLEDRGGE